jgi:hypothetical protein
MAAYLTKCVSVQKSHLTSYYLFLLICISSYWQDQHCLHHGIIQVSFGYLKVRFPGSEFGHKRTILKINMVINVCIYYWKIHLYHTTTTIYNRLDMYSNFHQSISSEISVPSSLTSWGKTFSRPIVVYNPHPYAPKSFLG